MVAMGRQFSGMVAPKRRLFIPAFLLVMLWTIQHGYFKYGNVRLSDGLILSRTLEKQFAVNNNTTVLNDEAAQGRLQKYIQDFQRNLAKNIPVFQGTNTLISINQERQIKQKLLEAQISKKYILEWYGKPDKTHKPIPLEKCGNCEITSDRSLINHPDTGAVFFLYNLISRSSMPPLSDRRTDQLYVWYSGEAPASLYQMRKMLLFFEDYYHFNVTQTYRRDSGVYQAYGDMEDILTRKIEDGEHKNISNLLFFKSRLSIAVVSNCKATAGAKARYDLLKRLIDAGLDVHTYGKCFNKITVPKTNPHEFEYMLKKFKFYFAFENSYHCRDYITEKFFINGFRAGTVPVAWGATKADYEAVAPPNSFIYAEDFETVQDLVDYLNYLDKNDTAYLEYFRWYQYGYSALPMYGRVMKFCQLCRQLHGINVDDIYSPTYDVSDPERPLLTNTIATRNVPSLKNWMYRTENKDCFQRDPSRLGDKTKLL